MPNALLRANCLQIKLMDTSKAVSHPKGLSVSVEVGRVKVYWLFCTRRTNLFRTNKQIDLSTPSGEHQHSRTHTHQCSALANRRYMPNNNIKTKRLFAHQHLIKLSYRTFISQQKFFVEPTFIDSSFSSSGRRNEQK